MKLQPYFLVSLLMLIFTLNTISVDAAHFERPAEKKTFSEIKKGNKKTVKPVFKSIFSKKSTRTSDDDSISKSAKIAFTCGLMILVAALVAFIGVILSTPILIVFMFIAAFFLSIFGAIFGIIALTKIKKSGNEAAYKKEKKRTKFGLISFLLAFLSTIVAVVLELLSL